jgi:hypothetical protein
MLGSSCQGKRKEKKIKNYNKSKLFPSFFFNENEVDIEERMLNMLPLFQRKGATGFDLTALGSVITLFSR